MRRYRWWATLWALLVPLTVHAEDLERTPAVSDPAVVDEIGHRVLPPVDLGLGVPSLEIRGFTDAGYLASFSDPDDGEDLETNSFGLGAIDLFLSSEIAEDFDFVSEVLFTATSTGTRVSVERLLLKYDFREWLQINGGRGHTALGYWFTQFHHGKWLYNTVNRPLMYATGGFLPVHFVGVEFLGSGEVGPGLLSYVLTVSNGRGENISSTQDVNDANKHKSVGLRLRYEPAAISGLGFGGHVFYDRIPDGGGPPARDEAIREIFYGAHIFYVRDPVECMAEVQLIHHRDQATDRSFESTGAYGQCAYRVGEFKPYYRFDFFAIDDDDPAYATVAAIQDTKQHTVGVRWDVRTYLGLKLEYRHADRDDGTLQEAAFQAAFAF